MGVTNLWSLLSSCTKQEVDVKTLSGQIIAVDLSAWIVEFRTVKTKRKFGNLYVRNLFYRILHLMGHGLQLVFVVDGSYPDIKKTTMMERQKQCFGNTNSPQCSNRHWFSKFIKISCDLLDRLGISWIQSEGEAEALCAQLNRQGIVDACMTEDSDVLLYGARTVYRNLRRDKNGSYVDVCGMDIVESELGLNQRDLIAMALLIGCDYGKQGVKNVGKTKSLNLVQKYKEDGTDPLERLCAWRDNEELADLQDVLNSVERHQSHCSNCNHVGTVQKHRCCGCEACHTRGSCNSEADPCQCQLCQAKREHLELNLREKALEDAHFPDHEIIEEFLKSNHDTTGTAVSYKSPDLSGLLSFINSHIRMDGEKMMEGLSEALINLQLEHPSFKSVCFKPNRIIKQCKKKHKSCYEVEWDKLQNDIWTSSQFYIVKVEKRMFSEYFPEIASEYESRCTKTPKERKRKTSTDMRDQTLLVDFFKKKKRRQFPKKTLLSCHNAVDNLTMSDLDCVVMLEDLSHSPCM